MVCQLGFWIGTNCCLKTNAAVVVGLMVGGHVHVSNWMYLLHPRCSVICFSVMYHILLLYISLTLSKAYISGGSLRGVRIVATPLSAMITLFIVTMPIFDHHTSHKLGSISVRTIR